MRRLGLAQCVVLVVAFGAMCLATGFWVSAAYGQGRVPTGWTGYAPLQRSALAAPLTTTEVLLVWLGIAAIWGTASALILWNQPRSNGERSRRRWLAQGEPSIRRAKVEDPDPDP